MNGLLHAIDGLCAARDWDALEDLADLCLEAVERGKQLWPIAAHIDYRLALEAPGDYAASVLDSDAGRFALGPLTEVAASTHTWDELAPYIEVPQAAAYVAQERVLRGEDLSDDRAIQADTLDLPSQVVRLRADLCARHFLAADRRSGGTLGAAGRGHSVEVHPAPEVAASGITEVLLDLVQPWTAESNGAARAVVVEDGAVAAASCLAGPSDLHMQPLEVGGGSAADRVGGRQRRCLRSPAGGRVRAVHGLLYDGDPGRRALAGRPRIGSADAARVLRLVPVGRRGARGGVGAPSGGRGSGAGWARSDRRNRHDIPRSGRRSPTAIFTLLSSGMGNHYL